MTIPQILFERAKAYEQEWNCPPTTVMDFLSALEDEGWNIVPPVDMPGVCPRCRCFIEDGTAHYPFNGNQMFACEIERVGSGSAAREENQK